MFLSLLRSDCSEEIALDIQNGITEIRNGCIEILSTGNELQWQQQQRRRRRLDHIRLAANFSECCSIAVSECVSLDKRRNETKHIKSIS